MAQKQNDTLCIFCTRPVAFLNEFQDVNSASELFTFLSSYMKIPSRIRQCKITNKLVVCQNCFGLGDSIRQLILQKEAMKRQLIQKVTIFHDIIKSSEIVPSSVSPQLTAVPGTSSQIVSKGATKTSFAQTSEADGNTNDVSSLSSCGKCSQWETQRYLKNCPSCKATFNSEKEVSIHMRRAHKELLAYQCELCSTNFKTLKGCKSHFYTYHIQNTSKKELLCKIRTSTRGLKKLVHNPYHCWLPGCTQKFLRRAARRRHYKTHLKYSNSDGTREQLNSVIPEGPVNDSSKQNHSHRDPPCDKSSETEIINESTNCGQEEAPKCSTCLASFKHGKKVCIHKGPAPKRLLVYKCGICSKKILTLDGFKSHLLHVHKKRPKTAQDLLCGDIVTVSHLEENSFERQGRELEVEPQDNITFLNNAVRETETAEGSISTTNEACFVSIPNITDHNYASSKPVAKNPNSTLGKEIQQVLDTTTSSNGNTQTHADDSVPRKQPDPQLHFPSFSSAISILSGSFFKCAQCPFNTEDLAQLEIHINAHREQFKSLNPRED